MKTLLINPEGSNFYARIGFQLPHLGLAYIAAVARNNGHDVRLLDMGIRNNGFLQDDLKWADVVGISANTPGYPEALNIAKLAKDAGKIVVMGGYHVSFLDSEALETGIVDFVVRGEGEYIFLNLINTIQNRDDLSQVPGISYMKEGKFRRNKNCPPPGDLDNLPFPARDLLPLKEFRSKMKGWPFTNLITSRGCPYNCYFCSSSKFGGLKWRARSAKSIADEIEYLHFKYGYNAFSFMDDNFTLSPKRVFEFADELEKRNLNHIRWWCFSRVDILAKNEEMIKRMAQTGAFMIFLGLESNNSTTLEHYNKGIESNHQQRATELLKKYGIKIQGSYLIGNIAETKEMVENTIKWALQINAESNQFSILTPYPGTKLFLDINKENRLLHQNWSFYDGLHSVIKLDHLSQTQIANLLIKAYRSVYLNFPGILRRLTNANRKSLFCSIKAIGRAIPALVLIYKQVKKYPSC